MNVAFDQVVFDTNVVISGAGWRGVSYRCLCYAARRRVFPCATADTADEVRDITRRLIAEKRFGRHDPLPIINW